MLHELQKKWKVSFWQLLLILLIFALGGSLTGYVGRKLILLLDVEHLFLRILLYIVFITIIWPITVLIVSIPFGQYSFFRNYISRIGNRLLGKKKSKYEIRNSK